MSLEPFIHLALIWTGVLLATWLAGKTRLTPVLWYLFIGAGMANTGILPTQPLPFIEGFVRSELFEVALDVLLNRKQGFFWRCQHRVVLELIRQDSERIYYRRIMTVTS